MWKAWLAQTDNRVVVEAMDASQDARLRLILAALILLFGIAITLIILALSRSRTSRAPQQTPKAKSDPQNAQQKAPRAAPSEVKQKAPQASGSQTVARESKAVSSIPTKSLEKTLPAAPKPERPATLPKQSPTETLTAKELQPKAPPPEPPDRASSAPARPAPGPAMFPTEPRASRPFDPKEYKKELAQMDPEKKRQEILQRLAEIQSDKKNAESRAAVRLPSVTAAPRTMPSPPPEPASSAVIRPAENPPTGTPASLPLPEEKIQQKESPLPAESATKISKPDTRPTPQSNWAKGTLSAEKQITLSDKSETPEKPESPSPGLLEPEDFSALSSIQRKLTNPPPRMAFRDWLRKIEREG